VNRESLSPWVAYFDGMPSAARRNQAEAADHVRRLRAAIAIHAGLRVLDFGCGPGLVGGLLGPEVQRYLFWDAAPTVQHEATRRLAAVAGAEPADLTTLPRASIDLILVNSVVQYMRPDELTDWLQRWKRLLAPAGRLVLSDLPAPGEGALRALRDTIVFAARQGVLLHALPEALGALMRYATRRQRSPIFCPDPIELARMATTAGLTAHRLPENLTFRARRYTIVFRAIAPEPADS
jgi:SAM-dependent methyltransferase